jgi:hypothetical protein
MAGVAIPAKFDQYLEDVCLCNGSKMGHYALFGTFFLVVVFTWLSRFASSSAIATRCGRCQTQLNQHNGQSDAGNYRLLGLRVTAR